MRIELERAGIEDVEEVYLDPATVDKLVKWLSWRGEKIFNYPNSAGHWNMLDVDTGAITEGIPVQKSRQSVSWGDS